MTVEKGSWDEAMWALDRLMKGSYFSQRKEIWARLQAEASVTIQRVGPSAVSARTLVAWPDAWQFLTPEIVLAVVGEFNPTRPRPGPSAIVMSNVPEPRSITLPAGWVDRALASVGDTFISGENIGAKISMLREVLQAVADAE